MTAHKELLLEIGIEELPASWLPDLTVELGERLAARLSEQRLAASPPQTFSTPRRLVAVVARLQNCQDDLEETITGPPVSAAVGRDGLPAPAGLGFARKHGVAFGDLTRVQTPKGEYLSHSRRVRGRPATGVLPEVLALVLRDLQFPRQMRWDAMLDDGKGELPFGRPIRWLLFLYGGRVVPFAIRRSAAAAGPGVRDVTSGSVTYGHRFVAGSGRPGRPLRVKSFAGYRRALAGHFVVLDREERRRRITRGLDARARKLGGSVLAGARSSFLDEVPDLVEYPAVIAGRFDPAFLGLPAEVLATTMIHHQHDFPVVDESGRLKPVFLAVTNTRPRDERPIAANAERVLAARLRDAAFFWDADRRVALESRLERLDTVLFHKALGSYGRKAARIADLAEWVAREALGRPDEAEFARRAARLAKADLTSGMVGEFPELQGVMGGVYAREEGQPEQVWRAIYHHYLPIGVERDAPPARADLGTAAVTWAAVSLADKLDSAVGLFGAGERPTGSRDPFGLRRQVHGVLRTLVDLRALTGLAARPAIEPLVREAEKRFDGALDARAAEAFAVFMLERYEYLLTQRGFPIDLVRAVMGVGLDRLRPADDLEKLRLLADYRMEPEFAQVATVFRRVRNIARELPSEDERRRVEPELPGLRSVLTEPAEVALVDEIDRREPAIDAAVASGENFRQAFAAVAAFGQPIDRFFTEVFVMVDEARLRLARLLLMKRLETLILKLADLSEIVPHTGS